MSLLDSDEFPHHTGLPIRTWSNEISERFLGAATARRSFQVRLSLLARAHNLQALSGTLTRFLIFYPRATLDLDRTSVTILVNVSAHA
jgi:hypothetical protein